MFQLPIISFSAQLPRDFSRRFLQWNDLNWNESELSIRRTLIKQKGGLGFSEPKTDESNRSFNIPPSLSRILRTHFEKQLAIKQNAPHDWNPLDLIFCTQNGTAFSPDNYGRSFRNLMKQFQWLGFRTHSPRHTFITLSAAEGMDLNAIAKVVGHKDIRTTCHYVHPGKEAKKKVIATFSENVLNQPQQQVQLQANKTAFNRPSAKIGENDF